MLYLSPCGNTGEVDYVFVHGRGLSPSYMLYLSPCGNAGEVDYVFVHR